MNVSAASSPTVLCSRPGRLHWRGCAESSGLEGRADGKSAAKEQPETQAGGKDVAIGFIYVGPKDDYGYNQAHAAGAAAVKKMPGVKIVEEESVPETVDVQKSMKSMIELDKAKIIFPTSFGYFDPHVLKMAKKYPERHVPALRRPVGRQEASQERRQLLRLHRRMRISLRHRRRPMPPSRTSSASSPPSRSRRCCATSTPSPWAHAASIRRSTCSVIFTGDWSNPVKEAEATNNLIDQGVDVITCHVDSPKVVVETAERRGIKVCGYHASQATLAPKGYLTGAEWNWEKVYTDYVRACKRARRSRTSCAAASRNRSSRCPLTPIR